MTYNPRQLFIEVRLKDELKTYAVKRLEVPEECAYRGPRIAEDTKLGEHLIGSVGGFDAFKKTVKVLEVNEIRKDRFSRLCHNAGLMIAEFLYDREGWGGRDRQEQREEEIEEDRY